MRAQTIGRWRLRPLFCLGPALLGSWQRSGPKTVTCLSRSRVPDLPVRGECSMHIVEVRRNGDGIAAEMNQMRDWLDAHRVEPLLFQLNGAVLSLGFENGGEATAFADAFDARVLSEPDARAALQRFALGLVNG